MADVYAINENTPNYSKMLFNQENVKTPFSTLIGSRRKVTNDTEFEILQVSRLEISKTQSHTVLDASIVTRENKTNVTQIFQESISISYVKMSNIDAMAEMNIGGQLPNHFKDFVYSETAARRIVVVRLVLCLSG